MNRTIERRNGQHTRLKVRVNVFSNEKYSLSVYYPNYTKIKYFTLVRSPTIIPLLLKVIKPG